MTWIVKFDVTFDKDRYHEISEIEKWCLANIGEGGWIPSSDVLWYAYSSFGKTRFIFKEEKHYNWFILRWA
jgi:hypothetical protein